MTKRRKGKRDEKQETRKTCTEMTDRVWQREDWKEKEKMLMMLGAKTRKKQAQAQEKQSTERLRLAPQLFHAHLLAPLPLLLPPLYPLSPLPLHQKEDPRSISTSRCWLTTTECAWHHVQSRDWECWSHELRSRERVLQDCQIVCLCWKGELRTDDEQLD